MRTDRDMLVHILNEIIDIHMADWNFKERFKVLNEILDEMETEIREHLELEVKL